MSNLCDEQLISRVYEKNCMLNNSFKISGLYLYSQNGHTKVSHLEIFKCP